MWGGFGSIQVNETLVTLITDFEYQEKDGRAIAAQPETYPPQSSFLQNNFDALRLFAISKVWVFFWKNYALKIFSPEVVLL